VATAPLSLSATCIAVWAMSEVRTTNDTAEGEILKGASTYDILNYPRDERTRECFKGLYG